MQTACQVSMGRKSRQYTIFPYRIQARLSVHSDWMSCMQRWAIMQFSDEAMDRSDSDSGSKSRILKRFGASISCLNRSFFGGKNRTRNRIQLPNFLEQSGNRNSPTIQFRFCNICGCLERCYALQGQISQKILDQSYLQSFEF